MLTLRQQDPSEVEFWTHRRYCWCARGLPGDQDLAALGALPGEKEYQEPPRNPRGADASKTAATARAATRAKHNPPKRWKGILYKCLWTKMKRGEQQRTSPSSSCAESPSDSRFFFPALTPMIYFHIYSFTHTDSYRLGFHSFVRSFIHTYIHTGRNGWSSNQSCITWRMLIASARHRPLSSADLLRSDPRERQGH